MPSTTVFEMCAHDEDRNSLRDTLTPAEIDFLRLGFQERIPS